KINGISGEYYTNHAMGLYWAYRALLELNDPLKADKLNEIVFFTDGNANWFPGEFLVRTGSGRCSSSPAKGVFGIGNGGYYGDRIFSYTAPNPPGKPSLASQCSGQSQGNLVLQYIKPTWYPTASPTYGPILPGGVSLRGYKASNPNLGDSTPT